MDYAERCKTGGTRLELGVHRARSIWKKKHQGKVYYFSHPLTKEGYQQALHEWVKLKSTLNTERANFQLWNDSKEIVQELLSYYDKFGVPKKETVIQHDLKRLLKKIEEILEQPVLPDRLDAVDFKPKSAALCFADGSLEKNKLTIKWMWKERLARLTNSDSAKEPQTIEYWLDKYINRVADRGGKYIAATTAKDRGFKLKHLKNYADLLSHVSTIDELWLEKYHSAVDSTVSDVTGKPLSKISKEGYFKAVKMWIRWASSQQNCEMKLPSNIDNRESGFREAAGTGRKREQKKRELWTKEEFQLAFAKLPQPYKTYVVLMLNCGFRHVDLSELRKSDVDLTNGRISIQRHKLNQQDTAPVISYKLWDVSTALLTSTISDHPELVFTNSAGGKIEGSLKLWWKRNKENYGNKRLDYLRKTGSTVIARYNNSLDEFYLGESLNSTARIHYSFVDGEPNPALDDAIDFLGSEFGLAEAPVKTVLLTDEMRQALLQAGFSV